MESLTFSFDYWIPTHKQIAQSREIIRCLLSPDQTPSTANYFWTIIVQRYSMNFLIQSKKNIFTISIDGNDSEWLLAYYKCIVSSSWSWPGRIYLTHILKALVVCVCVCYFLFVLVFFTFFFLTFAFFLFFFLLPFRSLIWVICNYLSLLYTYICYQFRGFRFGGGRGGSPARWESNFFTGAPRM